MDVVARKILVEHQELIKKSIYENHLFIEMQRLVSKNKFNILVEFHETKSFGRTFVFASTSIIDDFGKPYEIPIESEFYDEIGSLGAAECIFSHKNKVSSIKKSELTDEFWDDIRTSIEYLKRITLQ